MNTAGHCFYCDDEADQDPCPQCGRALYRPLVVRTSVDDGRPSLGLPKPGPRLRTALLLLAIVLLLLVIAAVASSGAGIT